MVVSHHTNQLTLCSLSVVVKSLSVACKVASQVLESHIVLCYSVDTQTGTLILKEDCQIIIFSENKRFSSFLQMDQ